MFFFYEIKYGFFSKNQLAELHMFKKTQFYGHNLSKIFSLERDGLVEFSAESNGRRPKDNEERKNYLISK